MHIQQRAAQLHHGYMIGLYLRECKVKTTGNTVAALQLIFFSIFIRKLAIKSYGIVNYALRRRE
jgi:hypothetical protein